MRSARAAGRPRLDQLHRRRHGRPRPSRAGRGPSQVPRARASWRSRRPCPRTSRPARGWPRGRAGHRATSSRNALGSTWTSCSRSSLSRPSAPPTGRATCSWRGRGSPPDAGRFLPDRGRRSPARDEAPPRHAWRGMSAPMSTAFTAGPGASAPARSALAARATPPSGGADGGSRPRCARSSSGGSSAGGARPPTCAGWACASAREVALLNACEDFGIEPWLIEIGSRVNIASGVVFVNHDGTSRVFRHRIPGGSAYGNRFGTIRSPRQLRDRSGSVLLPGDHDRTGQHRGGQQRGDARRAPADGGGRRAGPGALHPGRIRGAVPGGHDSRPVLRPARAAAPAHDPTLGRGALTEGWPPARAPSRSVRSWPPAATVASQALARSRSPGATASSGSCCPWPRSTPRSSWATPSPSAGWTRPRWGCGTRSSWSTPT